MLYFINHLIRLIISYVKIKIILYKIINLGVIFPLYILNTTKIALSTKWQPTLDASVRSAPPCGPAAAGGSII